MTQERLFSYAVILHPTEDERKEGKRARLVVSPTKYALYKSDQEVLLHATRQIPEDLMQYADRLEVAVRPFDRNDPLAGKLAQLQLMLGQSLGQIRGLKGLGLEKEQLQAAAPFPPSGPGIGPTIGAAAPLTKAAAAQRPPEGGQASHYTNVGEYLRRRGGDRG